MPSSHRFVTIHPNVRLASHMKPSFLQGRMFRPGLSLLQLDPTIPVDPELTPIKGYLLSREQLLLLYLSYLTSTAQTQVQALIAIPTLLFYLPSLSILVAEARSNLRCTSISPLLQVSSSLLPPKLRYSWFCIYDSGGQHPIRSSSATQHIQSSATQSIVLLLPPQQIQPVLYLHGKQCSPFYAPPPSQHLPSSAN